MPKLRLKMKVNGRKKAHTQKEKHFRNEGRSEVGELWKGVDGGLI